MSVAPHSRASAWRDSCRAAEHDDALGAEDLGRQHGAEADRAVTDDRDRVTGLDLGAHRGVVAGAMTSVSARKEAIVSSLKSSRDREEGAVGLRNTDELGLAAITLAALPKTPP